MPSNIETQKLLEKYQTEQVETGDLKIRPYEDIILFTGRKESGKSFASKYYAKKLKRVIIWDFNHEYDPTKFLCVNSLNVLNTYWGLGYTKIAYQPNVRTIEHLTQFLRQILNNYRFLTVIIEEIAIFQTSKKYIEPLKVIIDTGRFNLKIGLWVTSRRSHGITVDIPYNADHILAFAQHRPEDIDYLSDFMDSDKIEQLKNYPEHSFIHFIGKSGISVVHAPIKDSSQK